MSSSSSSNPNLSESDQDLDALNPNVPISVIKRLVIRMKELESSIAAWNLSLKGSVRLGRIERESIRSNIKIDESQRKSLLIGLDVLIPSWRDLEITEADLEEYRTFLLSNRTNPSAENDQRNLSDGNGNVPAQRASTSKQNSFLIPPKSVYVVPIPQTQQQLNIVKYSQEQYAADSVSVDEKETARIQRRRRVRDKTPEIEQSTAEIPPWNRPLFTRTKNWVTHFKPIEIMFLDHTVSKSEQERATYLKETIDSSLQATLCYSGDRLLSVAEINARGLDLFGPKKDAPFFCEVHGFGMHLTGDCTDSKKYLCEKCRDVLIEGVEHRCLVPVMEDNQGEGEPEAELQINVASATIPSISKDSNDSKREEESAIPYCALCYAKDGTKIEGSYDHLFEYHCVEKEDEDLPLPPPPLPNPKPQQEDYGWRRDNYYKGKSIEGLDKARDVRGRPVENVVASSKPTSTASSKPTSVASSKPTSTVVSSKVSPSANSSHQSSRDHPPYKSRDRSSADEFHDRYSSTAQSHRKSSSHHHHHQPYHYQISRTYSPRNPNPQLQSRSQHSSHLSYHQSSRYDPYPHHSQYSHGKPNNQYGPPPASAPFYHSRGSGYPTTRMPSNISRNDFRNDSRSRSSPRPHHHK